MSPGVTRIPVLHLTRQRQRSAATLGFVMVLLALNISYMAGNRSQRRLYEGIIKREFGADLTIDPQADTFTDAQVTRVASTTGVASVSAIRYARAAIGGDQAVPLIVLDPSTYFRANSYQWTDGDDRSATRALGQGGHLLLPEQLARSIGAHRGSTVAVETADGRRAFTVAGIFAASFDGGRSSAAVGLTDASLFRADRPSELAVEVTSGSSPTHVGEAIRQRLQPDLAVTVTSSNEILRRTRRNLDQGFQVGVAVVMIGLVVGLLALANTLAVSVLQRYREIALLRAVGMVRRDIAWLVLVESVAVVGTALALSLPLGWMLSVISVHRSVYEIGMRTPYLFPWAWMPLVVGAAAVVAVVAAVFPARRAARLDVVAALRID